MEPQIPEWLAKRQKAGQDWSQLEKHTSSEETNVIYPIGHFLNEVAKFDKKMTLKNGKTILNLSYGEPTKDNGF